MQLTNNILLSFSFSFILFLGISQELPKGLAPNERDSNFLETIGVKGNPYLHRTAGASIFTNPPSFNVRTMAEWEEIEALTITWSTGYGITEEIILKQIVEHAVNECDVIIICNDQNTVATYLSAQGISSPNIYYIETNFNSIWIRDYGQNTVYKNDVEDRILVDWIYNRNRPYDDLVPEHIAAYFNADMYITTQSPYNLMGTGGNFMSDGMGTGFSSKLILDENSGGYAWNGPSGNVFYPNHTLSEIENIMQDFMGIQTYILMETLPYDGIHHIDMHMKLLDEETILMAEYPSGVADGPQIEANLQYVLSNYNSAFGTAYKVVRIPSPPSVSGNYPNTNGYYRTYTNSVFVNSTVLVPFYRQEYDTIAQRIYEEALPGYNIVGIDVDNSGVNLIAYSGAIHCITHSVGANEPLLIQHQSLEDTPPLSSYTVSANIQHTSGVNTAQVYYTTDLATGFSPPITMTNTSNNTWEADIPGTMSSGQQVYYYMEAIANNGKIMKRPMPAPVGYFDFKILDNTTYVEDRIGVTIDAYPNPASAITCVPVNMSRNTIGTISLVDLFGKCIDQIYSGEIRSGETNYFMDASLYPAGIYNVVVQTPFGRTSKKLIIKK